MRMHHKTTLLRNYLPDVVCLAPARCLSQVPWKCPTTVCCRLSSLTGAQLYCAGSDHNSTKTRLLQRISRACSVGSWLPQICERIHCLFQSERSNFGPPHLQCWHNGTPGLPLHQGWLGRTVPGRNPLLTTWSKPGVCNHLIGKQIIFIMLPVRSHVACTLSMLREIVQG